MSVTVGDAVVYYRGDNTDAIRKMDDTEKRSRGWASRLGGGIKTAMKAATLAVVGAGAALTGLGVAGLTAAISVESAMAGVTKTTDGLVDDMGNLTAAGESLKAGFREMAKEIPTSVEELMHIGELGGQLGVAKENLLDFTETIAALGVTTNLSTEDAAMSLAQLMNVMSTNQEDIDKLGSVIVDLGNNFATTEADIVRFASRIAAAGEISGLSEADVLGISAAFSSVGVQAEAGGTAVQKVLMAMNKAVAGDTATGKIVDNTEAIGKMQDKLVMATGKLREYEQGTKTRAAVNAGALQSEYDAFISAGNAAEDWGEQLGDKNRRAVWKAIKDVQKYEQALAELNAEQGMAMAGEPGKLGIFAQAAGMGAEEFQAAWEADPAAAFQAFVEGLGRAGDDAMGILEDLELKDQRLIRSFLSLGKAGDLLGESLAKGSEAWEENNALTKEAEQRYRTTQAQIAIFKNRIRDVGATIGDALLPMFNEALRAVTPVVESIGSFTKGVSEYFKAVVEDGDYLNDYLTHLPESMRGVVQAVGEMIHAFREGGLAGLGKHLWDWLTGEHGAINAGAFLIQHRFAPQIAHAFSQVWPEIWKEISTWPGKFWEWLTAPETGALAKASTELDALVTTITTWSTDSSGTLKEAGDKIGQLIVDGIVALFGKTETGESAIKAFLKALTVALLTLDVAIAGAGADIGLGIAGKIAEAIGGPAAKKLIVDKLGPMLKRMVVDAALGPLGLSIRATNVVPGYGLLPNMASGGTVPGAPGTAVPIMAHGQERVIPYDQEEEPRETRIYITTLNLQGVQDVSSFLAELEALT